MTESPRHELAADVRHSIAQSAAMMHEYVRQGFTRGEAVYLCAAMLGQRGVQLVPPTERVNEGGAS